MRLAVVLVVVALGCAPQRGTIGAVLSRAPDGGLTVHEVPPGLGADRAGLAPGDRILLVDGRDVRSLSEKELRSVLRGEVGAPVKLTVVRREEVLRLTVKRTAARRRAPAPGPSP